MPGVQPAESGGRGRRGRRVSSSLSEINVVPLVDVMLVLLVIFMVTAPMIQRGVEVNLPVTRKADRIEGDRFFVTVPADYARNGRVLLGEEAVRVDLLPERIRQRFETTTDKQVYLRGDGSVLYKDLMDVFSRLMDAGVTQVGLVTDPPRKR
jgi:biopolymer transport protein TolR